jgi:hypothetical protein
VANTDARNTTRFEPVVRGGFVTNQLSRVDITSGTVTRFDLNTNFAYTNFPNLANQSNALAQPTAIAFGPSGANCFITAFGSDRALLIKQRLGHRPHRYQPHARGSAAAAHHAVRAASPQARRCALRAEPDFEHPHRDRPVIPHGRAQIHISHDPTPQGFARAVVFLYDAKLSGAGLVSALRVTSMRNGLLAWDREIPAAVWKPTPRRFSSRAVAAERSCLERRFHPMKGPMTTQTLRGCGLEPLHWRGDRTSFLHFNGALTAAGGTVLGRRHGGVSRFHRHDRVSTEPDRP